MDRMTGKTHVIVLMPVYRDWAAASLVCQELDKRLSQHPELAVQVLLVDDGSPDGVAGWRPFEYQSLIGVSVLQLNANVGHQRAICVGLCHIHEELSSEFIVVMDSDGEDRPEDAVRLIGMALANCNPVLFAARRKRFARTSFRLGYVAFRLVHRVLTGISVRVGNFSVLQSSAL